MPDSRNADGGVLALRQLRAQAALIQCSGNKMQHHGSSPIANLRTALGIILSIVRRSKTMPFDVGACISLHI